MTGGHLARLARLPGRAGVIRQELKAARSIHLRCAILSQRNVAPGIARETLLTFSHESQKWSGSVPESRLNAARLLERLHFYKRRKMAGLVRNTTVNGLVPRVQSHHCTALFWWHQAAINQNLVISDANAKSTCFLPRDNSTHLRHGQARPVGR